MDPKRQGEIALALLKYEMRKQGVTISKQKMRNLGSVSRATGISIQELCEFTQPIIEEFVAEIFAAKQ